MKKITLFFMGMLLAGALTACGSQNSESGDQPSQPVSGQETENGQESSGELEEEPAEASDAELAEEPDEAAVEEPADGSGADTESTDGKALVVYYSASGNTKAVAGYIAAAANAELFELVPEEPYSDADLDWTDDDSRVVYEHDHPDDRDIALVETSVPDWDSYDTVFVGYPIWWGIAAWPVDGFIEANDFTGKTVIPFCTSSSSGLGESGELLANAAGTGNWLEGQRFSSGASEDTVKEWFDGLGL